MTDEISGVSCCHCAHFIPDKIGDGTGLGECKVYNWVRENRPKAVESYFRTELGNKVFWGGDNNVHDRHCVKFKGKKNE